MGAFAEDRIEWQGKELIIKPPSMYTRGLFVSFLEENAVRFVRRRKVDLAEDYNPMLREVVHNGGAFAFTWGSRVFNVALDSEDGWKELSYHVLRAAHPEITRDTIKELWDAPGGHVLRVPTEHETLARVRDALAQNAALGPEEQLSVIKDVLETKEPVELEATMGGELVQKIMRILNRPNSSRPEASPGTSPTMK